MTDPGPRNGLSLKVTILERDLARIQSEVDDLKRGQPAVIAERVTTLSARLSEVRSDLTNQITNLKADTHEDIEALRSELASQRKILIGFFVSSAVALLGITLTYLLNGIGT